MPLYRWRVITREAVKRNPTFFFLFGDNLVNKGFGRGEPNVIGIPTKFFPDTTSISYFSNRDYENISKKWTPIFQYIESLLRSDRMVIMPADGIGTGRAKLKEKAPALFNLLVQHLNRLNAIAIEVNDAAAGRTAYEG